MPTEQWLRNEVSEVDAVVITVACLMSLPHPFVMASTRSMFSVPTFWCYIRVCQCLLSIEAEKYTSSS